ncbi:MAG: hypothetical protein ACREX9_01800, partial [Gammaproteobacteria bacterium]
MDIYDAFPSSYFRANDVKGCDLRLSIAGYRLEVIGDDEKSKPVLTFEGEDRALILNKTNGIVLADGLGRETDAWIGCSIELLTTRVPYQG